MATKTNGYYRKRITVNGKVYSVYGKTRAELFEKETQKRAEIEAGHIALYNPTLCRYYDHFTEIRRAEIKESTIRSQAIQFNLIAGVIMADGLAFGKMHIKDITRRNIEDARGLLLAEGKTPQYLNNCFAHLNHVFHAAVLDDTITKNPCEALKQLKRDAPPIGENRHRALTEEETKMFFQAAEQRNSFYTNAYLLMIKTGLRVGELTALYSTDIDTKNGFIHIRRTVSRNETGGYEVGEGVKTESGKRDIPLTPELLKIIRRQEEMNRMFFGFQRGGLLFRSFEGAILREYTLNREIKRICKAAAIEYFTCHSFRNTFATRFIEQRPQDYKILSELLGHKDIKITLNLYTHVMTENKIEAMKNILVKTS